MTALVASNSTFLLGYPTHNPPHSPGILLNSRSLSAPLHPQPHEHRQPSSFASSSSSASQTSESHSPSSANGEGPSRKIRFAPLPDPRRDDFPSVFYPDDSDSDAQPPVPRNQPAPQDHSPQPPPSPRAFITSDLHPDDAPTKPKSRTWGQKLLRPLLQPLLPSSSTNPDEASSGLFRTSSRDSTKANQDDQAYKDGVPLSRRMSTGCSAITSAKEKERSQTFRDGAPLTPVMSEGFASRGRKDGQRMLNGRVYGRRPSDSDAQKRKQALSEPEFVEWGYGGMGSVTNNHAKGRSGPDWAKLQSRGKVLGEGDEGDPEGDDGSGMGWVKRRREQREREKREKEEREIAQSVPEIAVHAPEPKERKDPPHEEPDRDAEEHHIYRAVSVPAPHHHFARHHTHHKSGDASGTVTPNSVASLSRANSAGSVPLFRTASTGSETLAPMPEDMSSGSSVASSASTTSSIDEEDDDDTERESDDDDDDDAEGRITSKCAGVEKISRHKE